MTEHQYMEFSGTQQFSLLHSHTSPNITFPVKSEQLDNLNLPAVCYLQKNKAEIHTMNRMHGRNALILRVCF